MKLLLIAFVFSSAAFAANDYDWNLRTNPIAWIVGPHIRLDYRLSEDVTFGVRFNYLNRDIVSVHMKGLTTGLSLTYSPLGAFENGWYVELGASQGNFKATAEDVNGTPSTNDVKNFGVQALLGYHWFWDNWNVTLGAGFASNSAAHKAIVDANGKGIDEVPLSKTTLGTDTSIGFAF